MHLGIPNQNIARLFVGYENSTLTDFYGEIIPFVYFRDVSLVMTTQGERLLKVRDTGEDVLYQADGLSYFAHCRAEERDLYTFDILRDMEDTDFDRWYVVISFENRFVAFSSNQDIVELTFDFLDRCVIVGSLYTMSDIREEFQAAYQTFEKEQRSVRRLYVATYSESFKNNRTSAYAYSIDDETEVSSYGVEHTQMGLSREDNVNQRSLLKAVVSGLEDIYPKFSQEIVVHVLNDVIKHPKTGQLWTRNYQYNLLVDLIQNRKIHVLYSRQFLTKEGLQVQNSDLLQRLHYVCLTHPVIKVASLAQGSLAYTLLEDRAKQQAMLHSS